MLTREEFKISIDKIKYYMEGGKKLTEAMIVLDSDFNGMSLSRILNDYILLLEQVMNDKAGWIQYFILDTEFGKKGKNCVTIKWRNKIKKKISLQTASQLYDLLKKYEFT